jgi:hypothetical protein
LRRKFRRSSAAVATSREDRSPRSGPAVQSRNPNGELIRRELTYKIVHVTKTPEQIENEDPGGLLIEHKPVEGNGHDSEHVMSSENGRENGSGNGYG